MSKNKLSTKIISLKSKVFEARHFKMLPFYLCYLIYQLDGTEETRYVKYLKEMTEHFMRIRWYYRKFPLEDKAAENVIKDGLEKLGYSIIDVKASA